jgi:hypothetical protein
MKFSNQIHDGQRNGLGNGRIKYRTDGRNVQVETSSHALKLEARHQRDHVQSWK